MKKRNYYKPILETHIIDQDISLVMMSYNDENNPPGDPFGSESAQTDQQLEQNSFESNPFEEQ